MSSVLVFILVLSVLILVHELGHFIMAKRAGLWVEEFGFGIPPRIFGKKFGETLYSINFLPFGGFVRIHGEGSNEEVTDTKRAFSTQPKKTKAKILVAGVVMNFLLAIIAFSVAYSIDGIPKKLEYILVQEVSENSPAYESGLLAGDKIIEINQKKAVEDGLFIQELKNSAGQNVSLLVDNGQEKKTIEIFSRDNPPEGEGPLGIVITDYEIYFSAWYLRPFFGVYYGFRDAILLAFGIAVGVLTMIVGLFRGIVPSDVAGPVGIYTLTSQAASYGFTSLISFVGLLSVNLAILNILPFPALDGGRLLFIALESVIGKKVLPKVETAIHAVGMALLILLIIAITIGDIRKLVGV